jgi:hypothetical protein
MSSRPCSLQPPTSLKQPLTSATTEAGASEQRHQPLDHLHLHRYMFSPANASDDDFYSVIRASQHPPACKRFLVFEDDLERTGLGYEARLLVSLLLLAVRQERVLVERPAPNVSTSRWCDRPPFSLQCLYEPWSHCSLPKLEPSVLAYLERRQSWAPALGAMGAPPWPVWVPVIFIKLSWFYRSFAFLWKSAKGVGTGVGLDYRSFWSAA